LRADETQSSKTDAEQNANARSDNKGK